MLRSYAIFFTIATFVGCTPKDEDAANQLASENNSVPEEKITPEEPTPQADIIEPILEDTTPIASAPAPTVQSVPLEKTTQIPTPNSETVQTNTDSSDNSQDSVIVVEKTFCEKIEDPNIFCEDFSQNLDPQKWFLLEKIWGSKAPYLNNGVIADNVEVRDGIAYLAANGDNYSGDLKGVTKQNNSGTVTYPKVDSGVRTGGVIVTNQYFGSGRYEVRAKLPKSLGPVSTIWTFHYQEIYPDNPNYQAYKDLGYPESGNLDDGYFIVINHEIDIELPTALRNQPTTDASYQNLRFNSWKGELAGSYIDEFFDHGKELNDDEFHTFRFDWYTGDSESSGSIDFYIDDIKQFTHTQYIPTIKGRFYIGTWFPGWAGGAADFDREFMEIDWVKITPFGQSNDEDVDESYPNDGFIAPSN